jgi:hypothetical protein
MENLAVNFVLNSRIFSGLCEHSGMDHGYVVAILMRFFLRMSMLGLVIDLKLRLVPSRTACKTVNSWTWGLRVRSLRGVTDKDVILM